MSTEARAGTLERIVGFSIRHRWLMLVLTLGVAGVGGWSFTQLPIDATPDITNVQVQVNTEAPGYSPLETEQRVTWPIETALAGLNAQRKRLDLLQSTQTLIAERDAVLARRQQLGLASEFSRLSEQRAALQNRSEMAVAQGAQALAYVALYKALGGAPLPAELQAAEPPAEGRQP